MSNHRDAATTMTPPICRPPPNAKARSGRRRSASRAHRRKRSCRRPAQAGAAIRGQAGDVHAADPFQTEIDSIDLAVSAMVVEEPTVWKFDDLDRRAEAALDHAQNAVERGKARLLLDRIAKFEDIKRRADTIQQVESRTDRKNSQLVNVADTRATIGMAEVEEPIASTPADG